MRYQNKRGHTDQTTILAENKMSIRWGCNPSVFSLIWSWILVSEFVNSTRTADPFIFLCCFKYDYLHFLYFPPSHRSKYQLPNYIQKCRNKTHLISSILRKKKNKHLIGEWNVNVECNKFLYNNFINWRIWLFAFI